MEEGSRLGLVGEVRNLDDGDVEVLAQGPADDVSRLIAWLYHGPRWASVASVRPLGTVQSLCQAGRAVQRRPKRMMV